MINYVKVKINNERPIWAAKGNPIGEYLKYLKCDANGEIIPQSTLHIILALPSDVTWEKPARMNNHYGELELIK